MKFNEKIIYLRKRNKWTQNYLGTRLNVSRQTISKWESGYVFPAQENLIKMSQLFEVPIGDLLDETKIMKEDVERVTPKRFILFCLLLICLFIVLIMVRPKPQIYAIFESLDRVSNAEKIQFNNFTEAPLSHVSINNLFMCMENEVIYVELIFDNDRPIHLNYHDMKRNVEVVTMRAISPFSTYYTIKLERELYEQMDDLEIDVILDNRSDKAPRRGQELVTLCKIRVTEEEFNKFKAKAIEE